MCCVATLSCWLQPTDPCTTPLDISQLLSFPPSNIPTFPPSHQPPVSPRLWDISGPSLEVGVCLAGRAEGCELLWCCVMCNGLPEMDTLTLYTCHSLLSLRYLILISFTPTITTTLQWSLYCRIVTGAELTATHISRIWWIFWRYQARTRRHCLVHTWRSWPDNSRPGFPAVSTLDISRDWRDN